MASIVRGSNEDFNMIFGADNIDNAYKFVSEYCNFLVYTNNTDGVYLKTPLLKTFLSSQKLQPVSTIGAGDNFNAGIIYGFIKENILLKDFSSLEEQKWQQLLKCGVDFASEACMSYDNYISEKFAVEYK
jgi:fructokinase